MRQFPITEIASLKLNTYGAVVNLERGKDAKRLKENKLDTN